MAFFKKMKKMAKLTSFDKVGLQKILKEKSPQKLTKLAEEYLMEIEKLVGDENGEIVAAFIMSSAAFLHARATYLMLQETQPREREI
mgnify:CR=1 FL=1